MKFYFSCRDSIAIKEVKEKIKKELIEKGLIYSNDKPDIVISIGGDGTFLRTIHNYLDLNPLFANINYGNLGYLCEYTSKELEEFILDLLSVKHGEKEISLLEGHYKDKKIYALNEIRVEAQKGETIVFDVFINDTYLETLKSDGCLISSSIGSSAMARSLGGAIVDNEVEMIEFVEKAPIQNRSYNSIRSAFVLEKHKEITLRNFKNKSISIFYDSKNDSLSNYQGEIKIKLSNKKIRVLKNKRNNYIRKTHEAFIND